jgi:hypothetical protein
VPTIYSSKKDEAGHLSGTGAVYKDETVCERLIFVEGIDEVFIIARLIANLYDNKLVNNDVQLFSCDGKDQYSAAVKQFTKKRIKGDLTISHILLIGDADKDPKSAFSVMQEILEDNGFPVPEEEGVLTDRPPQTAVFILPSMDVPGMMEDVCMESVGDDPVFDCIDTYFNCLDDLIENGKLDKGPKNLSKAKTAIFLASRPEYKYRIGYADKYWNFSHDAFKRLRDILETFIG